jgi:undecaprenyl diphosphate synthase
MVLPTFEVEKTQILAGGNLPRHVAIIMDGNGRWAEQHGKPRVFGHRKGAESVRAVVEAAGELGIEALTLFAFSEENWGRPTYEVSTIMTLLDTYIVRERQSLNRNQVSFRAIGDLQRLPHKTQSLLRDTENFLCGNRGLSLNIALSYGGRSEIADACRRIAEQVEKGQLKSADIDSEVFQGFLWTRDLPDPDLLIRTSGELRISNFLLWQIAYTELYFSDLYWPQFGKLDFYQAVSCYQKRQRRFGNVSVKLPPRAETSDSLTESGVN